MLRFSLRLAASLILVFIIASFALIALGSTQPIHPALRGFVEGCEGITQPCWYGIVPGVTSGADAVQLLIAREHIQSIDRNNGTIFMGRFAPCSTRIIQDNVQIGFIVDEVPVGSLSLSCSNLATGDMHVFGEVRGIGVLVREFAIFSVGNYYGFWTDNTAYDTSSYWQTPFNRVSTFFITSTSKSPDAADLLPWLGFVPFWRYCQLEPEHRLCL